MITRCHSLASMALFGILAPAAASAQVYRCQAPDGSTTFQQTPCTVAQRPVTPAAVSRESSNPGEEDFVQMVLLAKVGCDVVPDFATRSARDYAAWRTVRAAAIDRVEGRASYRAALAEAQKLLAEPHTSSDVADMRRYCEATILPLLGKEAAPADRRFGTPERTFTTFIGALRAGDRDAALACFGELGAEELRDQIATLPVEKLRETGNSFVGTLVLKEMLGPLQTANAPRKDGRDHPIFFDRQPNGDWKIAGI